MKKISYILIFALVVILVIGVYKFWPGAKIPEINIQQPTTGLMSKLGKEIAVDERGESIFQLGQLKETRAVNQIVSNLDDKNAYIRKNSVIALERTGSPAVFGALRSRLADENEGVRLQAAVALGTLGDKQAFQPLLERLNIERSIEVKKAIVHTLGELKSKNALPILISTLDDPRADKQFKDEIIQSLGKISDPVARPALEKYKLAITNLEARFASEDPLIIGQLDSTLKLIDQSLNSIQSPATPLPSLLASLNPSVWPSPSIFYSALPSPLGSDMPFPTPTPINTKELYQSNKGSKRILILINGDISDSLYSSQEFMAWQKDLEAEDYYLQIYSFNSGTAKGLKDYLRSLYQKDGLEGVILIGDLPFAWYSHSYWYPEIFPNDLYLTDLDGLWIDSDSDGLFDSSPGDVVPEIWLGRIKTSNLTADSSRDEVGKLRYYFAKDSQYRHNNLHLERRALSYNDDDWYWFGANNLDSIYSDVKVIQDSDTTVAEDYKNRLKENYEWIHVSVHSNPNLHSFKDSHFQWSNVYYWDINSIDPQASFYNLFACGNANYQTNNYMAGDYIFNRTWGLAAVGSTKTGSMLNYDWFYPYLGTNYKYSLGEAFKQWFTLADLSSEYYKAWFYGMTIIGDPTLTLFPALSASPSPLPSPSQSPSPAPSPSPSPSPVPSPSPQTPMVPLTRYRCNGYPNSLNYRYRGPNPYFYVLTSGNKTISDSLANPAWDSRCTKDGGANGVVGYGYSTQMAGTVPLYLLECHIGSGSRFSVFNTTKSSELPSANVPLPSAYSYCQGYQADAGNGLRVRNNGQPIAYINQTPVAGTIGLYRKVTGSFFGGKFHLSSLSATSSEIGLNKYKYSLDAGLLPGGLIGYIRTSN